MIMWTFWVQGPPALTFVVTTNPKEAWVEPLVHDGGRTLWKLFATQVVAKDIASQIEQQGPQVQLLHETLTKEQEDFRKQFLQLEVDGFDLKSDQCKACYFLDLNAVGFCGLDSWDQGTVKGVLRDLEIARKAKERCPVRKPKEDPWDASL